MNKIEVGEYVRSLVNGNISKVLEISDLLEEPNIKYYKTGQFTGFCSTEEYNYNHSKNIIDLIEVGDYVNGHKVVNEIWGEDDCNLYFEIEGGFNKAQYIREKDIKSIITKEQFKEMEYRV